MHGFALNIRPDMEHYKYIIACGIVDKGVTTMETLLGRAVDIDEVKQKLAVHYGAVYERDIKRIGMEDVAWV